MSAASQSPCLPCLCSFLDPSTQLLVPAVLSPQHHVSGPLANVVCVLLACIFACVLQSMHDIVLQVCDLSLPLHFARFGVRQHHLVVVVATGACPVSPANQPQHAAFLKALFGAPPSPTQTCFCALCLMGGDYGRYPTPTTAEVPGPPSGGSQVGALSTAAGTHFVGLVANAPLLHVGVGLCHQDVSPTDEQSR